MVSLTLHSSLIRGRQLTLMQTRGDSRPVGPVQQEGTASESVVEKQQQAIISTLKASVEKLQVDKAKSDDAVKELQKRRGEAEEREQRAFKAVKQRWTYAAPSRRSYCKYRLAMLLVFYPFFYTSTGSLHLDPFELEHLGLFARVLLAAIL